MKKSLILLAIIALFSSCQSGGERPPATADRDYKEICADYDIADRKMRAVIDEIEEANKEDIKFIERFRNSQIYWIQYKDRHMRALYSEDWDLYYRKNYGKEIFNGCKCKELIRFTETRIGELQMFLEGGPEGQAECPSTWNVKNQS